ncbi:MAG: class I SAM-dependent methyltransferase [Acidobacteriaceae bacterium]
MNSGSNHEAPPTPELFFNMLSGHQRTAALKTAIELDLFRAVGEGPGDVASLARQCAASERGIRILCDFLTIHGLLGKEDGRYRHSPTSAVFLDPRSPACLAPTARFLLTPALLESYNHLTEIVRTGRTALPGDGTVEPENPIWVEFAKSMVPMMAPLAGPFGELVLQDRTGPMRVLDIAAGHGLFGIAIAKLNREAHVTALDWASVLQVALENARKAGVQDRYETLPGSAFDLDFGGPYDAVLLTNFLHHFDKPTCVCLLKKIHTALRPGGCVATLEFVPNEDRVSPPMSAAFSMTMLTGTPSGDAYTLNELTAMYKEAGFSGVAAHPLPMNPETVVMGNA